MILLTSIPKSGTHLVAGIYKRLGFRTAPLFKGYAGDFGEYGGKVDVLYTHHRVSDADFRHRVVAARLNVFALIRDPRDIVLSLADYVMSGKHAALIRQFPYLEALPKRELVRMFISGKPGVYPPIGKVCRGMIEWKTYGGSVIRYEDFLAVQQGGAPPFLGVDGVNARDAIVASLTRPSKTRNVGKARRWQSEFDDDLRSFWNQHARSVPEYLGYE